MSPTRSFAAGCYAPSVTPFKSNGDLDVEAVKAQSVRLAKAGMGIVLLGTNGECSHMTHEERAQTIKAAREAVDGAGLKDTVIVAGTGGGSARDSIKLCEEAKEAGADYCILIVPAYHAFSMGKNRDALREFFTLVADASPIPVMIYNFPGAAGGIDLDSDQIIELSEHQNICGVKLTCAGIGKGYRISAHVKSEAYQKRHKLPFVVMPGFTDYMLPALVARSDGVITGTGNVIPKTIVKLYKLSRKALESGNPKDMEEALKLQDLVSQADWTIVKAGIPGTKYALSKYCSEGSGVKDLGGIVRSPLPQVTEATKKLIDEDMKEALAYENSLP